MKKIFEKHEILFCILLIVIYIILNSYCIQSFGLISYENLFVNIIISTLLILLIIILKRVKYYGLTKPKNNKKLLYFIPLILISTINLWCIDVNNSIKEILIHILIMINIGFIEEIIFRGFLLKMMEKEKVKNYLIISAFTFGIGHIVNLLNGSDVIPTLIQIISAIAIGYVFALVFLKSGSIIPCVITHIVINATSIFSVQNVISLYIAPIFLIVVSSIYIYYIKVKFFKNWNESLCLN